MNKKNLITKENAAEYQARGVAARKANKERRQALKEILSEELSKPIGEGSTITKAEWLVAKMIQNLRDDIKPADLKILQELLGESISKHEITTKAPESLIAELMNEI